jgi:hypothetical protein
VIKNAKCLMFVLLPLYGLFEKQEMTLFLGHEVDMDEDTFQQMCKNIEALEIATQGGRRRKTERMGNRARKKRDQASEADLGEQEQAGPTSVSGSSSHEFIGSDHRRFPDECNMLAPVNRTEHGDVPVCRVCVRPFDGTDMPL